MALPNTLVWEVQTGGSDDNGGAFVSGGSGTDYSQQTSAQATLTTASVVNSTTTIIDVDSGDYTCTDSDVDNVIKITGGTATAGRYRIVSRSGQQWTLDRSAGTAGQTVVGNMGGCAATPGEVAGAMVSGNHVWIKSGTYTLSTSSANTSGGQYNPIVAGYTRGYATTRGDLGARPVLNAGTQINVSLWYTNVSSHTEPHKISNVDADGNSQTGITGFLEHTNGRNPSFDRCAATGCVNGFSQAKTKNCRAYSNSGTGFIGSLMSEQCVSHDNSVGMTCALDSKHYRYLAHDNTNQGANVTNRHVKFFSSAFIDNGNDGIEFGSDVGEAHDCIFYGNTGYGVGGSDSDTILTNCAFGSNTAGAREFAPSFEVGGITLTADPFTDNANDDYTINNTAGGGALLRAESTNWLGDYQTTNQDVGPIQHTESAGSGSNEPPTTTNVMITSPWLSAGY